MLKPPAHTPAQYRCMNCGSEWQEGMILGKNGWQYPGSTWCRACNPAAIESSGGLLNAPNLYVLWLNFDAMRGKDFNK